MKMYRQYTIYGGAVLRTWHESGKVIDTFYTGERGVKKMRKAIEWLKSKGYTFNKDYVYNQNDANHKNIVH